MESTDLFPQIYSILPYRDTEVSSPDPTLSGAYYQSKYLFSYQVFEINVAFLFSSLLGSVNMMIIYFSSKHNLQHFGLVIICICLF